MLFWDHKDHYILMKLNAKGHTTFFHLGDLPAWTVLTCISILSGWFLSCNSTNNVPPHQDIVTRPEQMNERVPDIIGNIVGHIAERGKIDSIAILQPAVLPYLYEKSNEAKWSKEEKWLPIADSVMSFIENSMLYGLFPEDYHFKKISFIKERIGSDTLALTEGQSHASI